MRMLLGMILGVALTVAGAFAYDTLTGRIPDTVDTSAIDQRPMVNWDVVGKNWHSFEASVREMGSHLHEQLKKLTG